MRTSIKVFKRDCVSRAKALGDYQSIGIDELANGYCKAYDEGDESKKDSYMSALVLRFWYVAKKMMDKTITANYGAYEDYVSKLYECISVVMAPGSRAWQDPKKRVSAQACINQAFATRGVAEIMYESNLDKRKANVQAVSLDSPAGDDDSDPLIDMQADDGDAEEMSKGTLSAERVVQACIDEDKVEEAMVLDVIAFGDSVRRIRKQVRYVGSDGEEKVGQSCKEEFWRHKAVKDLSELPEGYLEYFGGRYDVRPEFAEAAFRSLKSKSNPKLYKTLDATLKGARSLMGA